MPATAQILVSRTRPLAPSYIPVAALVTFTRDGVKGVQQVWDECGPFDPTATPNHTIGGSVVLPVVTGSMGNGFNGVSVEWLANDDSVLVRNQGSEWSNKGIIPSPCIDSSRRRVLGVVSYICVAVAWRYPALWIRGRMTSDCSRGQFYTNPILLHMPETMLKGGRRMGTECSTTQGGDHHAGSGLEQ